MVGEEVPKKDCDFESKDDLMKAHPETICLEVKGQEFLFTKSGELWVHGCVDDVIEDNVFVAQIYGNFLLDEDAQKAMQKGGVHKFALTGPDHLVGGTAERAKDLPDTAMKVSDFLTILAENNIEKPTIECHELEVQFIKDEAGEIVSSEYKVRSTKACVLQPLPVPHAFKQDHENLGSRLILGDKLSSKFDISKGTFGNLIIRDRLTCLDSKQFKGIAPGKPGLTPKQHTKVVKGALRQWA